MTSFTRPIKSLSISSNKSDQGSKKYHVPFPINKSGIPLNESTWDRLWEYATELYPDHRKEINHIRIAQCLEEVPIPSAPLLQFQTSTTDCLQSVQSYIHSLTYNHTGTQLFNINKTRPLAGLMDTAKEIVRESLPIKCLEAVVLSLYLTSPLTTVNRFPIGFKSEQKGRLHYHIVLGLSYAGMYGAMGISRRKELMDKPLVFRNLSLLIENFNSSYAKNGHLLKKVRIGLNVSHDIHSMEKVAWRCISVSFKPNNSSDRRAKIDKFSKSLRSFNALPELKKRTPISSANYLGHENPAVRKRSRTGFTKRSKRKIGVEVAALINPYPGYPLSPECDWFKNPSD